MILLYTTYNIASIDAFLVLKIERTRVSTTSLSEIAPRSIGLNIPLKLESKLVTYYKNLDPLLYLDDASPMSTSTDGDTAVAPGDEAHSSHSGLFNIKYLPPLPHYISIETKQKLAIPIELPSVALPKAIFERLDRAEHEEKKEMLLDIEMLVGRSTILLGICMIFNEVTTGVGLLDQLSHIFQLF